MEIDLLINNPPEPQDQEQQPDPNQLVPSIVPKTRIKREKERTIGFAYSKVHEWKEAQKKGINDQYGHKIGINLDVAANLVGLSRKTLDDY